MAIKRIVRTADDRPTIEQLENAKKAAMLYHEPDPDFPEQTPEELKQFYRVKDIGENKHPITIFVSDETMEMVRDIGDSYRNVVGEFLDSAIKTAKVLNK